MEGVGSTAGANAFLTKSAYASQRKPLSTFTIAPESSRISTMRWRAQEADDEHPTSASTKTAPTAATAHRYSRGGGRRRKHRLLPCLRAASIARRALPHRCRGAHYFDFYAGSASPHTPACIAPCPLPLIRTRFSGAASSSRSRGCDDLMSRNCGFRWGSSRDLSPCSSDDGPAIGELVDDPFAAHPSGMTSCNDRVAVVFFSGLSIRTPRNRG